MDNISCVNALWVCSVDVATRPSIPVKYASDRPRHDEGIVAAAVGQHGEAAQNSLQCVRGLAIGISPWRGCRLGRGIGVFRPGEGGEASLAHCVRAAHGPPSFFQLSICRGIRTCICFISIADGQRAARMIFSHVFLVRT